VDSDLHVSAAAAAETETVGTILRRLRESKAISLSDAAEATRITRKYLQAIEADHPEELPSPAYLKGFVKTYAEYLGLQGEELLLLLNRTTVYHAADSATTSRSFTGVSSFNWQRLFLPSILLGALIISTIFFSPTTPPRTAPPVRPQTLPTTVATAPVAALQPVVSSTSTPVPANQAASEPAQPLEKTVTPPLQQQNGFQVSMKVTRNSTLTIVIDDGAAQGYDLNSGDLIEWKAMRTITMDISDAGSVELQHNSTPLKLQAPSGKPVYIVLDANGIQR